MSEPFQQSDYELFLDKETQAVVRKRTLEIKGLIRRTAQHVVAIGQKLIEVKAILPHGMFSDWLKAEFDWTGRTARRFMSVADTFPSGGGKNPTHKTDKLSDLAIAPSALYLLAASSTPSSAREETIERAEAGEVITHAKAKSIIASHKSSDEPFIRAAPSVSGEPRLTNRWIESVYRQIANVVHTQDRRLIAESLTASQLQQISEMIDFLQDIEALGQVAIRRQT